MSTPAPDDALLATGPSPSPPHLRRAAGLMAVAVLAFAVGASLVVAQEIRGAVTSNDLGLIAWAVAFLAAFASWAAVSLALARGVERSRPWAPGLALARALAALPLIVASLIALVLGGGLSFASFTRAPFLGARMSPSDGPIWLCLAVVGAAQLAAEVLTLAGCLSVRSRRRRSA